MTLEAYLRTTPAPTEQDVEDRDLGQHLPLYRL